MKVKCLSNESWDFLHNLRDKLTIGNRFRELSLDEKRELKLKDLGI